MSNRSTVQWAVALFLAAALPFASGCRPKPTLPHSAPVTGVPSIEESHAPADPSLRPAWEMLQRKDYAGALQRIESARSAAVTERLRLKSEVFRGTDYLDLEMKALQEWTRRAPADTEPLIRLFYIYLDLGWRREAGDASARALKVNPNDFGANIAMALYFYRSAEPIRAVPYVERAMTARPRDRAAVNLKATVLLKSRRFAAAEQAAREAISIDPRSASNHLALAQALSNQARIQEAETALKTALDLEPGSLEALFERGSLAQKRGDIKDATSHFERVAAADAQFGNVAYRLGSLYLKQGKTAEGRKLTEMFRKMDANTSAYETALSRLLTRPDDPTLHYRLGRFRLEADELPQAIVEFRQTLALDPKYPQAKRDLIHALMRHGRTTEAQKLLDADRQAAH